MLAEKIANDESLNWIDRIRATAEVIFLGEEKQMRCKMPKCRGVASRMWSLVPVCNSCYEDIRKETNLYYAGKISADERVFNKQIKKIKGA